MRRGALSQTIFCLLYLTLMMCTSAIAHAYVLEETLTKPVRSSNGEVIEYAITFVLKDKRERPVSNVRYMIVLGTGKVVCGSSMSNGMTQRVSSGMTQTTASISLSNEPCPSDVQDDEKSVNFPGVEQPKPLDRTAMPANARGEEIE